EFRLVLFRSLVPLPAPVFPGRRYIRYIRYGGGAMSATAAERARRYRARRRCGRRIARIEIDAFEVADLLVEAGFLEAWDAEDPRAVDRALSLMLPRVPGEANRPRQPSAQADGGLPRRGN